MMNYDERIIGAHWFIFSGHYIYNPVFYLCCFPKYFGRTDFHPYLIGSAKIFAVCAVISLLLVFIWGIARQLVNYVWNIHGTARFAAIHDLKVKGLLKKHGIVCGELNNAVIKTSEEKDSTLSMKLIRPSRLICHSGKLNTLLLGPTGSGKSCVIISSLLSWRGSCIIYDPKRENYDATAGWRRTFSHVILWSPCDRQTVRFNPVMAIRDGDDHAFRDASLIADIIFSPSKIGGGGSSDTEQYFSQSAKDATTTAILHIRFCDDFKDKSLAGVLHYLTYTDYRTLMEKPAGGDEGNSDQGREQYMSMLNEHQHFYHLYDKKTKSYKKVEAVNLHKIIADGAMRLLNTNPKEKASVFKTIFSKLQMFEDPLLAAATSGSDFEIEDFINSPEPISLYLAVPYSDVSRIQLVFRILISFMLKKFSEGTTHFGAVKLKNELLFLLDEFTTLGAFPDIAQNMGVLRGYGVHFLVACQAMNQLTDIYGINNPFLDHCPVRIIYSPNASADAKMFSDSIGQESIHQEKISRGSNRWSAANNFNYSDNDMGRNLLDSADIMRIPGDKFLLLVSHMQPYIGSKVVYYQDARFKYKLNMPVPKNMKEMYEEISGLPSRLRILQVAAADKTEQEKKSAAIKEIKEPAAGDDAGNCMTKEDYAAFEVAAHCLAVLQGVSQPADDGLENPSSVMQSAFAQYRNNNSNEAEADDNTESALLAQ
jgi:type IV secretion system protein VirD4